MWNRLLVSAAIALAMSGCANQQGSPLVRDISQPRPSGDENYTVQEGDTLYGIAWQQDMDYRQLAAINNIDPPFSIFPGQQLTLQPGGNRRQASSPSSPPPVDTAPPSASPRQPESPSVAALDDQEVDWLLPADTSPESRTATAQALAEDAEVDREAAAQGVGQVSRKAERQLASSVSRQAAGASQAVARVSAQSEAEQRPSDTSESRASQADALAAQTSQESSDPQPSEPQTPAPSAETQTAPVQVADSQASEEATQTRSPIRYRPAETIDWQWPAEGPLLSAFGEGESITAGIDIGGQKGQPVKAAGPGIVVYAGNGVRGYGNLILIKHNDEFLSAYAHNDALEVAENDVVRAGQTIATMGDDDTQTVRVHFEVRRDGKPVDPLDYLPGQ